MKFKIVILIFFLFIAFSLIKVFLSDFFINNQEIHIVDKYYVLEINGEYNLMQKEQHGYSLTVPAISNIYLSQRDIIVISDLDGNKFINYKNKYSTKKDKYYYNIKKYKVKEINEEEFLKKKKMYTLKWHLNK